MATLANSKVPASRRRRGLVLLSEADPGKNYVVSGIYERDRHLLEFLEARGIRPGARLGLLERNYDKTLSIRTANPDPWCSAVPLPKEFGFPARPPVPYN